MVLRKSCAMLLVLVMMCVAWADVAALGDKMPENNALRVEMVLSGEYSTPNVMTGVLAVPTSKHPDPVKAFLHRYETTFAVTNLAENVRELNIIDDVLTGDHHVRMQQLYKGIPIEGADFYVTIARNQAIGFTGKILPEMIMNVVPKISKETAKSIASRKLKKVHEYLEPELVIVEKSENDYALAYKTIVIGTGYEMVTAVDATNGAVIYQYNNLQNYSASMNTYYSGTKTIHVSTEGFKNVDTIPNSYIQIVSANNAESWSGTLVPLNAPEVRLKKAAEVMYALERSVDYFKTTFSYLSYDNKGASLTAVIDFGRNHANAYWSPSYKKFAIGDGGDLNKDGTADCDFLGSIDIVGHEFSHGFCSATANLTYRNESGALNEANSDIFATQIDPDLDWYMGEDVMYNTSTGLRDIVNPERSWGYALPRYYGERYTGSQDNGGVHINCSLGTKFFQLLVDGGTWFNGSTNVTVEGIGREKAIQIWYRAMTVKFTTSTTYSQARNFTIAAATDLYGASSNEVTQVGNAWTAVGVVPPPEDTYEPNGTVATSYGISFDTIYESFIFSSSDVDYYKFSITKPGAVTINLKTLTKNYDMYLYDTNGTTELARANGSSNPEIITKDLSAMGTYYVKIIGKSRAYSKTEKYVLQASFVPDEGEWYYETLNPAVSTPHNYPNSWTNTYTFTKIGAKKVAVYFSRFDFQNNYDFVYIYDKNNVQIARYTGVKDAFWATVNGDSLTVKVTTNYSTTRYGYDITQTAYFNTEPLSLNALVYTGNIASLPSDVGVPGLKKTNGMLRNMPDPFNPETDIAYEVPENGNVVLSVFTTKGKKVIELVNGNKDAGSHSVHWNGKDSRGKDMPSGVYYAVLEVNGSRFTKKMIMLK